MPLTKGELGRRIRSARESCGLTQEQLGDLDRIAYAVGRDIKSLFAESRLSVPELRRNFRDPRAISQAMRTRKMSRAELMFAPILYKDHILYADSIWSSLASRANHAVRTIGAFPWRTEIVLLRRTIPKRTVLVRRTADRRPVAPNPASIRPMYGVRR